MTTHDHSDIKVREYRDSDFGAVAAVMGRAFADETMNRLTLGERGDRTAGATRLFELRIDDTLRRGGGIDVATIDDRVVGACLWEPPTTQSATAGVVRQAPSYIRLFKARALIALVAETKIGLARPKQDHWYLHAIGADPEVKVKGIGSALLDVVVNRLPDGEHMYLESSNDATTRLYERFGFLTAGEIKLWPGYSIGRMWRP